MKISFAIKLTTYLLLFMSLVSCKKMLKEYNPSGITAEAAYTTPEGFETLVNGAYSYNRFWYGKEEGFGASEMGTDLWTCGEQSFIATAGNVADNRNLTLYQNLVPQNVNLLMLWKRLYAAVNLCNTGIKIDADGTFHPSTARVGELKFLRAWYYWHIVETWGGVHFTTEPTTTPELTANRTPVLTFYTQIVQDLRDAIVALPTAASPDFGRVNQNIAKAFLARVLLTRGYISPTATADFTEAQSLAVSVAASYSLVPKYENLWSMSPTYQKASSNPEIIWSINYPTDPAYSDVYNSLSFPDGYGVETGATNRGNNNSHLFFVPGYDTQYDSTGGNVILNRDVRYGRAFLRFKPSKYLLNLYDETKDTRWDGSWQTVWKMNKAGVGRLALPPARVLYRDTALFITKNAPFSTKYYTFDVFRSFNPDGTSKTSNSTKAEGNRLYPCLKKFLDSTRYSPGGSPNEVGSGNVQSAKNFFIIRNAEMYMIAAEAEFKLNGATAACANYLNVVRTRAEKASGLLTSTTLAELTAGGMDFILDERAREFAGEQIRWFDLKRTGMLASRVALNPDITTFKPEYALRPIPQVQIDAVTNKDEFVQNPGY